MLVSDLAEGIERELILLNYREVSNIACCKEGKVR